MLQSSKLQVLKFVNRIIKPSRLALTPEIYRWRTWSAQRRDVLEQLKITKAFDVGACTGKWFAQFRDDGFACPVESFECDPRALEILNTKSSFERGWTIHPYALASQPGKSTFNLWSLDSGQSSLKSASADSAYFKTVDTSQIEQTTVLKKRFDEIFSANCLEGFVCLLKVDVQGAEMDVLVGIGDLLDKFAAIEIELALCDFYEDNDIIEDVLRYLRVRGFDTFTIQTERWGGNNGTLAGALDCDVLLVNRKLMQKIE